jgi:hypothetical protein
MPPQLLYISVHYFINKSVHTHKIGSEKEMGHRWRRMYYLTGLPGWIRFGYSPGWVGRSPTGLPPTAQWIAQSGLLPQYLSHLQTIAPTMPPTGIPPTYGAPTTPATPFAPTYTKDQEKQMLEQQMEILKAQLDAIKKRLEELSK